MRLLKYLILFSFFSCNSPTKNEKSDLIKSLEHQIDTAEYIKNSILIDSLLNLDSNNLIGLKHKGVHELNNRDTKKSIKYFGKYLKYEPNSPLINFYTGISFEHEDNLDTALFYYEKSFDKDSTLSFFYPHLLTVLHNKNRALEWLSNQNIKNKNSYTYLRLINDINNYQQSGINEFYPIFFDDDYTADYYIKIPDSIYNNGIINSMHKVELFYAKNGINIDVEGTDNKNNGYYFSTTGKYKDKLEKMDTFSLTRLQLGDRLKRPFDHEQN